MAVAFDAVGPAGGGGASTLTAGPLTWAHINSAAGNAICVGVNYRSGTSPEATAVSYGGVALSRLGTVPANNIGPGGIDFWGRIGGLPTGSNTVSVTFTGGAGNATTGGSVSLTGAASFGTVFTTFASAATVSVNVTGTTSGGMIVAVASYGGTGNSFSTNAPGTQRWAVFGDSNTGADNTIGGTWSSPGGTQAAGFTQNQSDFWGLAAVEVKAAAAVPPERGALLPLLAPGWFPGSAAVTQDPGGIPFYAEPPPAVPTPAVIFPPTPEAAGIAEWLPLPPGWFPGAQRVTGVPGGIPFSQSPPPLTPPPAVIFPVPETAGIADYLPLPPGYFPGSQTVTVDPGGIPFYSQPLPLNPPPAPAAPPVISGLGGGGTGWFTDQYGQPRFLLADNPWALIPNAGRWGGTWQTDIDTYCNNRGGQGYTAVYLAPLGNLENNGVFADGRTQDGVYPFTVNGTAGSTASLAGSETIGLNPVFWARVDYFLAACVRNGMTGMLNVIYEGPGDFASGGAYPTMTVTQFGQYGSALAARYASVANIIWVVGNDYFGGTGGTIGSGGGTPAGDDAKFSSLLSGLRGGGDAHVITIHNFPESDARQDIGLGTVGTVLQWGNNNAQVNGIYSYNTTYLGIEDAYGEPSPLPVMQLDGYFYQGTSTYSASPPYDRAFRQDAWWAVSSGARGVSQGSESVWQWSSTALAASGTDWFHVHNAGNIRTLLESLPGWHLLIPDTASVLVTAGRGTRHARLTSGGGSQYEPAVTDTFVSASRTPDGSLAVVYLSHGTTITIDQSKLGAGYTATWVDPVTCATSSATTGTTYNSTAKGNNSQGDPDWVLVFQGPPVSAGSTAAVAAAGAVTAKATVIAPAAAAAASAVTAVATQAAAGSAPGAGSVSAVATQAAGASLAGAGAVTAAGSVSGLATGTATIAGAGAVSAVATQAAVAAPAGAGSVTAVSALAAKAAAAGAGSLAANAVQAATSSLAGAGTVGPVPAVQGITAAPAGAGSVSANAVQAAVAAVAAASAVTATGSAGGASTANLAGAGTVTAVATVAAPATAAGAGAVAAVITQRGAASLTGAGAVTAAGALAGSAALAGAAALTAKATQAAIAAPAGASALTALAVQRATATLAAAGAVAAAGSSAASIVNATSSPAVTAGSTSAPAVTGPGPATAVTSKASSNPAVSDG